ncbi:MAG: histidine phosphatase family protein [bacterium]
MLLFLVRHAQSTWNLEKRVQGQKDPDLSSYGKAEAKRLAKRFKGLKFAAAYSSPLARARGTAEIIVGKRRKVTIEEDLTEWGLGKWEGKTIAQIRKAHGDAFRRWVRKPSQSSVPGGEPFKDFVARVKETLRSIKKRHPEGNVLVVCHGGVISAYATTVLHLPPDDLWCLTVKNASLTIVDVQPRMERLVTFNDISHLKSLRDLKPTEASHVD